MRFKAILDKCSDVARNNFLTDKFTTLGGLAAVAYGSSLSFGTVADQIKRRSITKSLDSQLPSNVLLDFLGTETVVIDVFKSVFQSEYDKSESFTDFIDIYSSIDHFSYLCAGEFLKNLNKESTYNTTLTQIIEESIRKSLRLEKKSEDLEIDIKELTNLTLLEMEKLDSIGQDVEKVVALTSNNPVTKITSAVPDTTVSLSASSEIEKDYRGVNRSYGTVPPREYFSGAGYKLDGNSIRKSVTQGYVGYPLVSLLGESLLNPDSYDNLTDRDTNISILSELDTNSGIPADRRGIYNLNLARIDLGN